MHAGQAVVSGTSVSTKDLRADAFAIVPHPQANLPPVIADFNFNPPRGCVAEGVAHGFAGNAVHFVPQNRMQISRLPSHLHMKGSAILAVLLRSEFVSELGKGTGKVVLDDRR